MRWKVDQYVQLVGDRKASMWYVISVCDGGVLIGNTRTRAVLFVDEDDLEEV